MNADLIQEWECKSKWNIIFLDIIDNNLSFFSFGHIGLPMFGFSKLDMYSLIRYTVGLYYINITASTKKAIDKLCLSYNCLNPFCNFLHTLHQDLLLVLLEFKTSSVSDKIVNSQFLIGSLSSPLSNETNLLLQDELLMLLILLVFLFGFLS
jgi:hypothetical protein